MRALLLASVVPMLVSCGDSKFAELTDSELQSRYAFCENADSLSPGAAITCDNIRRECGNRADERGRRVCF